jgi:hypothetical protein
MNTGMYQVMNIPIKKLRISLLKSGAVIFYETLDDPVSSDHTKNDCYNSNNEKNVNDVTHSETCKTKIADKPKNDKNYSNCIKKISHCDDVWLDIRFM